MHYSNIQWHALHTYNDMHMLACAALHDACHYFIEQCLMSQDTPPELADPEPAAAASTEAVLKCFVRQVLCIPSV